MFFSAFLQVYGVRKSYLQVRSQTTPGTAWQINR